MPRGCWELTWAGGQRQSLCHPAQELGLWLSLACRKDRQGLDSLGLPQGSPGTTHHSGNTRGNEDSHMFNVYKVKGQSQIQ